MVETGRTDRRRRTRWWPLGVVAALLASLLAVAPPALAADPEVDTSQLDSILESAADTVWRDAVQGAINPDDYVCGPTALNAFVGAQFSAVEDASLGVLFFYQALDWPLLYKLFIDNDDTDEFIGIDGEYTREHLKRQRDLIRFWDVPLDGVDLYGMHGAIMQDDAKMVALLEFFGVPTPVAQQAVDDVQEVIETDPALGYDWPLFSFNAVAFGPDPLKIVMGDGLIEFFESVGLADNGVDLVYAHEVAHHVQGALGLLDGPPSPEGTRRTELMADAFATYYLVHARGASYNAKRVLDAVELSFIAGDCQFDSNGHHGTPNQREAAAAWGADVAQERPRGKIRPAAQMIALFDAQLPVIVAPDAP